jgi:hypothetical protein
MYSILQQYCAPAFTWRLVIAVKVLLVGMFVHRASVARPCGPGQDSGYDGDQQRCGGGMLSQCPPRYPNARFWSVSQHPTENIPRMIVLTLLLYLFASTEIKCIDILVLFYNAQVVECSIA